MQFHVIALLSYLKHATYEFTLGDQLVAKPYFVCTFIRYIETTTTVSIEL